VAQVKYASAIYDFADAADAGDEDGSLGSPKISLGFGEAIDHLKAEARFSCFGGMSQGWG
jgi:hypothetical protein